MKKRSRFLFPVPWMTGLLTIVLISVWYWERNLLTAGLGSLLLNDFAFNWTAFITHPFLKAPTLITSAFLHGDSVHLYSNLFFFLLFAVAVERALGSLNFLIVYLLSAVGASLVQGFFDPMTASLLGASGAMAGVAGAFVVVRPLAAPLRFLTSALGKWVQWIPAFLFVALWLGVEFLNGLRFSQRPFLFPTARMVAHWAHVGGFCTGAFLALLFSCVRRIF